MLRFGMSSTSTAPFYVAVLLYASSSEDPSYTPMFEECFLLLRADDDEQARSRAEQLGQSSATTFTNSAGQKIQWSLKHVVDVNRVLSDAFDDGSQLYARHFNNYAAYCAFEPLLGGAIDGGERDA